MRPTINGQTNHARRVCVCPKKISEKLAYCANPVLIYLSAKTHGGRSQVVKAVDCDSTTREFKSRRPPFLLGASQHNPTV
jgi:hypothetical protein